MPIVDIDRGPVEYRLDTATDGTDATGRRLPPLVFLHEGLGSMDLWRDFPDAVRAACGNPTTLVYSRHGYGHSAVVGERRLVTYMHHEADVVLPALLATLGLERPLLVGHSDGASIALLYAGASRLVAGLALLAPHVFVEDRSVAGIEAARDAYESTDLPARMARHHTNPDATFRGWNDVWLAPEFRSWNIEDRLSGIECPVLLVQGDADEYGTVRQLDAIEHGVHGHTERVVLRDVGHAPHLAARDETLTALARFVRQITQVDDSHV